MRGSFQIQGWSLRQADWGTHLGCKIKGALQQHSNEEKYFKAIGDFLKIQIVELPFTADLISDPVIPM